MNTVFLILTNECNLNCPSCLNQYNLKNIHGQQTEQISFDKYKELIVEFSKLNIHNIIFTGGEPLLYKKFPELLKVCSENNINTLLLTNGLLLDNNSLQTLKNNGLNGINLSLNKLMYKKNFNKNLEFYKNQQDLILKYFDTITSTYIITAENFNKIYTVYENFDKKSDKTNILFQPIHLDENADSETKKLALTKLKNPDWTEAKNQLSDWIIKYNTYNYFQLIKDYFTGADLKNNVCLMGTESMVIDYFGNVYPCFHRKDLYCGNIQNNKIKNVIINCMYKSDKIIKENFNCINSKCLSLFINTL